MKEMLDKIVDLKRQIVALETEIKEKEKEDENKNKRWRAKEGNKYWFVDSGAFNWTYEFGREADNFRYDTHNYFETEEEANTYANILQTERQLKKFADEHNDVIDWYDSSLDKYYLCYRADTHLISIDTVRPIREPRIIYFSSEEITKQAIDTIGAEKIKEYITYEW